MKKLFIIFLCTALFLPLYADDSDSWEKKGKIDFGRKYFELGIDAGAGFANNLLGRKDIFTENIVIDMDKIEEGLKDDGAKFSTDLFGDFYLTIKNIGIAGGKWNIGYFSGAEGSITGNIPKNLFTLITKGNAKQRVADGTISASGGIYAETGLGVSAQYGRLKLGVTHALYAPMVYIPKSGIKYRLDTDEGVALSTHGDIRVYSPFLDGGEMKYGFDLSFNGAFGLFSFLDVGASLDRMPIAAAKLRNYRGYVMEMDPSLNISGQDLMDGEGIDIPELKFNDVSGTSSVKVYRPMRLDFFARLKPFSSELLVLTPNIGFTVNINDKILTLSTCKDYTNGKERVVMHAKLIKKDHKVQL